MTKPPTKALPMTEDETPVADWAIAEALRPYNEANRPTVLTVADVRLGYGGTGFCATILAYARLIEKHEQPPADPLLLEAREICAARHRPTSPQANRYRRGLEDGDIFISITLAALRRGMELAGDQS